MSVTQESSPATPHRHHAFTLALVGNPNAGKTTLFNALTGLRAKTANFAGTTVERKVGRLHLGHQQIVVVDLPGLYSLDSTSPDEKLASDVLHGRFAEHPAPDAALVVVDATNLERNLFLVSQLLELDCPVIVALNMRWTWPSAMASGLTWRNCALNSAAWSFLFPHVPERALRN